MKLGRILVLLVLVAGLGAYLYFYEVPHAQREAKKEKLLGVDKDAVTGVTLTYPDREIELAKKDGTWRLVKPVDAPADEAAANGIISTLTDAEVQKTLDDMPKDLASFGLDKPTVTATLTLKDGAKAPTVSVGKNTAIGGKTYVKKGEEPKLYLTTSSIGFGLNKQVKDLRNKELLTFKDEDVEKVEIAPQGAETVTLVRKDKDSWTVDPGDHAADATEVRSYLSSLRSTRAVDFPDDAGTDLAKYGLMTPRLVVTVAGKDGAGTQRLLIGGETTQGTQKQIYAKRDDKPTVVALGDWSFRTLTKTSGQFRDKTVLGFDPSRVGKVVLARKDGTTVTLTRADGGWKVEGADGKPKDTAITTYLDDMRDLRGSDIAAEPATNLAQYGLDQPDLRITLTDKEGQGIGTVLAAKHDGKEYVARDGTPTVFEARDYMYARLDKQPRDFVELPGGTTMTVAPSAATPPPPAAPDDADEGGEPEDEGE